MDAKRISLNGKVGIIIFLLGSAGFLWTFYMRLRPMELFIPRISLVLIALGGLLILLQDFLEDPAITVEPSRENILPYIAGVVLIMWLYGWSFRNIGILTSTFFFLIIWWIWLTFREAKRLDSPQSIKPKLIRYIALSLTITTAVYLLFIALLGMYLPRTPLP